MVLAAHAATPHESSYLPDPAASQVVTVAARDSAEAAVTVLTQAVAVKETGRVISRRGSPPWLPEPALVDCGPELARANRHGGLFLRGRRAGSARGGVTAQHGANAAGASPALQKTSYVLAFHREGLFNFYCTMHQPEMSGQILVLPPRRR